MDYGAEIILRTDSHNAETEACQSASLSCLKRKMDDKLEVKGVDD